jgi:hypothetical protein
MADRFARKRRIVVLRADRLRARRSSRLAWRSCCGTALGALSCLAASFTLAGEQSSFFNRTAEGSASRPLEAATAENSRAASQVTDIALSGKNTLSGRFIDVHEQPIDGAVVALIRDGRGIARTTTDIDGTFQIDNVPAGVYRLTCGSAAGWVRCWSSEAAPPNAIAESLTFQDGVVRGQAALLVPAFSTSSLIAGAATTGAVVGGVSVAGVSDHKGGRTAAETEVDSPPATFASGTKLPTGGVRPPVIKTSGDTAKLEVHEVDGETVRVIVPQDPNEPTWRNNYGDPRDSPRTQDSARAAQTFSSPSAATAQALSAPSDRALQLPASP